MNKMILVSTFTLAWFGFIQAQTADDSVSAVKIWEEKVTRPTFVVDEPDRIPRFYEGRA